MKTTLTRKLSFMVIVWLASLPALAQFNTKYGDFALSTNTGNSNSAFGTNSMRYNTTGSSNTAVGSASLYNTRTSHGNTAVGASSIENNWTGGYNTATGIYSLRSNSSGSYNVANGAYSLYYNEVGIYNTGNGAYSLYANTSGFENTATGYRSLQNNTLGSYNTAYGAYSLRSGSNGFNNTSMGHRAMELNGSGSQNTATGSSALHTNYSGGSNSAHGYGALYSNRYGNSNTATGTYALYDNEGSSNSVFGYNSGRGITSGSGNTIIGANVTGLPASLTNTIILADGTGNQRLVIDNAGKTRIGSATLTTPGTYKLYVEQGILTEKVVIAIANSTEWADYVFDPGYYLTPLTEVEKFVNKNHHLPNVPSAGEIVKNGVNLAAMDAKLLEKIEELTLYLIEQNAKNTELMNRNEALLKKINDLENRTAALEVKK
jgi:hypothetical protein